LPDRIDFASVHLSKWRLAGAIAIFNCTGSDFD